MKTPVRSAFYSMPLRFLLLFVVAVSARAQDLSQIPPPKSPLVASLPDTGDWVITVKDPSAPPPGSSALPQVTEVHTVKTGNIRRDDITYTDGKKTVRYFAGALLMWAVKEGEVYGNDMSAAPAMPTEDPDPTLTPGFPGTRWLQLSYYDKVVVLGKRPCYHYVHGTMEAWIDTELLLPVAYKKGTKACGYKFNETPAQTIVLPTAYQKLLDGTKGAANR